MASLTWIQLQAIFVLKALPGDDDHKLSQEIAVLGERGGEGMREGSGEEGEAPAQASPQPRPPPASFDRSRC